MKIRPLMPFSSYLVELGFFYFILYPEIIW